MVSGTRVDMSRLILTERILFFRLANALERRIGFGMLASVRLSTDQDSGRSKVFSLFCLTLSFFITLPLSLFLTFFLSFFLSLFHLL
jgi:hypothetical protein